MVVVNGPDVLGLIVENIGGGEVVVIAFLALVILGPERLPEMARGAGRLINKVRTMSSDLSGEMSDVINDPSMQPIRELGEFATRPRQKLAEYALEAEAEERQRKSEAESKPDTTSGTSGDEQIDDATIVTDGASEAGASNDSAAGEPELSGGADSDRD